MRIRIQLYRLTVLNISALHILCRESIASMIFVLQFHQFHLLVYDIKLRKCNLPAISLIA